MVADFFFGKFVEMAEKFTCLGNETSSQFVLRVSRYTARRSGLKYEKDKITRRFGLKYEKDENSHKVWPRICER